MASQQPATFSPAFQARLRKAATEGGMTPAKALSIFENYIENKSNSGKTSCNGDAYVFRFPEEIKYAPNVLECLRVLKTNLEEHGFLATNANYHYTMHPYQYTFIKSKHHECSMLTCFGECSPENLVCQYNDVDCHTIMVCL